MNHLYAEGKTIHECEGSRIVEDDRGTYVVWTKCGRDVPANMSFRNDEKPNCPACELDSKEQP